MGSAAMPSSRRARLLAAASLLLAGPLLLATESSAGDAQPALHEVTVDARPTATHETYITSVINSYRRANGRAPVVANARIHSAAQGHAAYMARVNRMTHVGSGGTNAGQRLTAAGVRWSAWGENIAVGYTSSIAVFNAWRNSAGHRAVMLNSRFTHLGLGVAYGHGRYWWCLVMADL
jgi:uncharacterized protein YkwD